MGRNTVFLSHSSKDIDKVRQIRNILETLQYEPLLFYLKCLDDDNKTLEDFIKKEIEARNCFIYCKSENSEKSAWVQKELEYIRNFDSKRLFTINIDKPLQETLVQLLQSITDIIKKNRVFISCSHAEPDKTFGNFLEKVLTQNGYDVVRFKILDTQTDHVHKERLNETGIFIPVISRNSIASTYCKSELETVLFLYESNQTDNIIFPIYYGISEMLATQLLPSMLASFNGITVTQKDSLTNDEINILLKALIKSN